MSFGNSIFSPMVKLLIANLKRFLSVAVLLWLLIGCASSPSDVSYVSDGDFDAARYSTIAIENATGYRGPIYSMIDAGIEKVFSEKGFQVEQDKKPDLLVRYVLLIERGEKLVERIIPTQAGIYSRHTMEPVNEARFLVNIVDLASDKVVWKASTVRDISGKSHPEYGMVEQRLAEFFADFPEK